MKRLLIAALLAVAAASAGTLTAAAAPPRASLTGFQCVQAPDAPGRGIQTTAVMRPVAGTKTMQLRFQLLMKAVGATGYSQVSEGDLGRWLSPPHRNPPLGQRSGDKWEYKKPVVDLVAPATYKFRADFRWLGTHGRVLQTATRYSPTCFQRAPDLFVKSIDVKPVTDKPNLNRYVAVIGNDGSAAAGPFEVQFTDGAATPKTRTVKRLAPRRTVTESFVGPLCATGAVTVTVDPADQIDDYDRSNNAMTAVCS